MGELFEAPARRTPDLPIRVDRALALRPRLGERFALADVAGLTRDIAAELAAAGLRRGDRLAVMITPTLDVSVLEAAAARVGAVPALLWPDTEPATAEALLRRLDRPLLVTDRAVRGHALAGLDLASLTRGVITVEDGRLDVEPHSPPEPDKPLVLPEDVALIAHTSGTTGVPKLVGYPAFALGAHLEYQIAVAAAFRLRGPDSALLCVSFVHGRMTSGLAVSFARRMPLGLLSNPAADSAAEIMREMRPTLVESFPNVFLDWERLADAPGEPLSSVQWFNQTFDAVHPRTVQRLLDASHRRFPLYCQVYGTTETGPLTLRIHTRATARRADGRCVGYPLPGFTRVRVRDLGASEGAGEIEARAIGASRTYVGESDRQAPGSADAWWRTGDVGVRTRWGCLHLFDRAVDDTGLESNLAIEDRLLSELPFLSEVVIVRDAEGHPVPIVCTAGDAPLDRRAWDAAVAVHAPQLAEPVHLPWAGVPRTSTWKVRRFELRRRLREGILRSGQTLEGVR